MNELITIGIPAYKAHSTITKTLASILIQSIKVKVIISNDNPNDNYTDIISLYPELNIIEITTDKNSGPGVARQKALNKCDTPYITFIDADDVFATPYSLEHLLLAMKGPNTVVTQGAFLQVVNQNNINKFLPRNDLLHPWVFGRLYNVDFIRKNKITFGLSRAMEDGYFNACIRMLIEGTNFKWNAIEEPVYYWSMGSEHSITRFGTELNNGIPLYNYGLCPLGSAKCFNDAIKFVKNIDPFKSSLSRVAAEQMVTQYITYYMCIQESPIYSAQNLWVAKWFYLNCYRHYESIIPSEVLDDIALRLFKSSHLKHIPTLTFNQWFTKLRDDSNDFDLNEINDIRSRLPIDIINAEKSTGVVGDSILEFMNK
jgi:glycosyltransferase involved in cell wall biosynthesis